MKMTLEDVRKALTEHPEVNFTEIVVSEPSIRLANPLVYHAIPRGGEYKFIIWPKLPSDNLEYLKRIHQSLPGYETRYYGNLDYFFDYREDGTVSFPSSYSINTPIGNYKQTLSFSISDENFEKRLRNNSTPYIFTEEREIYSEVQIIFVPDDPDRRFEKINITKKKGCLLDSVINFFDSI